MSSDLAPEAPASAVLADGPGVADAGVAPAGMPAAMPGASLAGAADAPGAGVGVAAGTAGAGANATAGRAEANAARPLDLLHGVEMAVTVELGRTRVLVRDLLGLRAGSIIELDRPAGGPVDVVVNGTLLARGEVVVVDDELGVRITEVVGRDEEP